MSLFLSRALLCLLSFFYFFFPSYSIYYNRTRLLVLTHLLHYFTVFHRRTRAPFSFLTLSLSLSLFLRVCRSFSPDLLAFIIICFGARWRTSERFFPLSDRRNRRAANARASAIYHLGYFLVIHFSSPKRLSVVPLEISVLVLRSVCVLKSRKHLEFNPGSCQSYTSSFLPLSSVKLWISHAKIQTITWQNWRKKCCVRWARAPSPSLSLLVRLFNWNKLFEIWYSKAYEHFKRWSQLLQLLHSRARADRGIILFDADDEMYEEKALKQKLYFLGSSHTQRHLTEKNGIGRLAAAGPVNRTVTLSLSVCIDRTGS